MTNTQTSKKLRQTFKYWQREKSLLQRRDQQRQERTMRFISKKKKPNLKENSSPREGAKERRRATTEKANDRKNAQAVPRNLVNHENTSANLSPKPQRTDVTHATALAMNSEEAKAYLLGGIADDRKGFRIHSSSISVLLLCDSTFCETASERANFTIMFEPNRHLSRAVV